MFDELTAEVFTHPAYVAVRDSIAAAGGAASTSGGADWVRRLSEGAPDERVQTLVAQLGVEPLETGRDEPDDRYVRAVLTRLEELAVTRHVSEMKGKLQRLNPLEQPDDYNKMFGKLVGLEQRRATLREALSGL